MFSQNFFKLFRLSIPNLGDIFKKNKSDSIPSNKIKKDPIVNNISTRNFQQEENSEVFIDDENQVQKTKYFSPSLEILETDEDLNKKKLDKENIKANSNLLEKVFQDFNIDIQVVNVKLGPVVTLFEILPAAGIKINTIINLADDISRSMGVGAVRIAQIYGTQYLGVEVPNEKR